MAEISKQALKVDNNQSFPNNNNGAITPSILRAFNVNMIDSMVDEISYNVDSASWNSNISQLNAFTASATGLSTGSLLVTASAVSNVITFTKGNGSTFNVTVGDTTDLNSLNAFTSSQLTINTAIGASTSSLNTFTSSANTQLTNLATSQSIDNTKWNTLGTQSGSFVTESETGSFADINKANTFTQQNNFTSISASSFVSASAFVGDGSKITNITASVSLPILDEGIPQGNAVSLNFTGSAISAIVVGGTAVIAVNAISTASLNELTQSFNNYTSSTDDKFVAVGASTSSLNQFTASQETKNSTLATYTASVDVSLSNINQFTSSQQSFNSSATASIVQLLNLSSSLSGGFVTEGELAAATASLIAQIDTKLNTSSFNQYTQSNDQRVSSLEANSASVNTSITNINTATASLFTSASLAIITASVLGADITFTKGNGSQFTITTATGSVASASYAETASLAINALDIIVNVKNTTGAQIDKGTVVRIIGATGDNPLIGTASWEDDANSANTLGFVVTDIPNDAFGRVMTQGTLLSVNTDPALGYTAGQLVYLSSSGQFTNQIPPAPYHEVRLGQVLRAQQNNGSIYVLVQNGYELSELHDVDINTGSLANNDLLAYNSASGQWENKTLTQVGATTTASFNQYTSSTNLFTASVDTKFATLGGLTGSYATTGSNNFQGEQKINNVLDTRAGSGVILTAHSGSLILTNSGFQTGSYSYISASANTQNNLLFQQNNAAADFIVSGSFNISAVPAAPTAGFKRVLHNGNIALNASNVPQLSGSMAFPVTMNQNYLGGNATTITARGPVSSSAWNVIGNTILGNVNIGSSATLNAEKIVSGLNLNTNVIQGTLTIVANQSTLSGLSAFSNNSLNGTATLNLSSSAAQLSNNIINDSGFVLTNQFFSSSVGLGVLNMNRNTIGGQNNQYIITGSQPAGTTTATSLSDNFIFGGNNILYIDATNSRVSGSNAYFNLTRTGVLGNQLIVSGSSLSSDLSSFGSVFVGRYNADGARNKTSDVVFAVGTGNTSARKTGFLIDSGSNTFVEGSLNVSGSASFTGSVYGNVVSMSVASNTASMDLSLGNYFELTSSASPLRIELTNIKAGLTSTLIVSASVSTSIAFSSNVKQPSPGAYSGSAVASTDILSFVAFNSSKANLVATKNIV